MPLKRVYQSTFDIKKTIVFGVTVTFLNEKYKLRYDGDDGNGNDSDTIRSNGMCIVCVSYFRKETDARD